MDWTCTTTGGAVCGDSGSGALHDTLTAFPSGSTVTYILTVSLTSPTFFTNTASIEAPFPDAETTLANNTASVKSHQIFLPVASFTRNG